jgi:hypothetical protein
VNLAPVPAVKLTQSEIAFLARHVGFEGKDVHLVTAIAPIESGGGFTNIYRPESENPLGGQDTGLMQINSEAWGHIDPLTLFDPIVNLQQTRNIIESQRAIGKDGWWPWNYGLDAYGPRLDPPRAARTDAGIQLEVAISAAALIVNPYWRMKDAGMDVHDLQPPPRGIYLSRLPLPPLKFGDSGSNVATLQQLLVEMGLFIGTTDRYYGPRVRAGVAQVQQLLTECGLWAGAIDGKYSIELHTVWDGSIRFQYLAQGR